VCQTRTSSHWKPVAAKITVSQGRSSVGNRIFKIALRPVESLLYATVKRKIRHWKANSTYKEAKNAAYTQIKLAS
jgi:hypothetical protein